MKKLVIYGDSILRGITYSDEKSKYQLRNGYKLDTLKDMGLEVTNHSRMGATIDKGLTMLERSLEDCDSDSFVLLEFGGNDSDYNWERISENPDGEFTPNTPEDSFATLYGKAIGMARSTGATVILSNLIPIDAEKYLDWISRKYDKKRILKWLGDTSMLYRFHEHYNRLVERIAKDNCCPLIDVREEFLLSHESKSLISLDGIHPSERGHRIIENNLRLALQAM